MDSITTSGLPLFSSSSQDFGDFLRTYFRARRGILVSRSEEEEKKSKAAAEQRRKDRLEKARKEDEELAPHRLKPEEMFEGIKRELVRPDHSQVNDDRYAILKSNRQRHYNAGDHDEAKRQTPAELEADRLRRQQQFAPPEPHQKVEQVVGSAYVLDAAGNLIDPKEEVKKMTA